MDYILFEVTIGHKIFPSNWNTCEYKSARMDHFLDLIFNPWCKSIKLTFISLCHMTLKAEKVKMIHLKFQPQFDSILSIELDKRPPALKVSSCWLETIIAFHKYRTVRFLLLIFQSWKLLQGNNILFDAMYYMDIDILYMEMIL